MTIERNEPIQFPAHPPVPLPLAMEALSDKAKIYVGNLPEGATDDVLSEYFSKYGRVLKATPAKGRPPWKRMNFGFVWFADEDSAKAAVRDVEDHVIMGTKVEVRESERKEPPPVRQGKTGCSNCNGRNPKKIFVGGLPSDLNEEEFKSLFERYGETTDVVLMVDSISRRPRGFGYVTFASEESAKEVLRHNKYLIRGKEVEVKVAIPKEESDSSSGYPTGHSPGQYYPLAAVNGYSYQPNTWNMYSAPFQFAYPVAPVVPYYGFQPWPNRGVLDPWASRDHKPIKIDFEATRNFKPIKITEPPGRRGSSSASGAEGPSPAPAERAEDVQLTILDEITAGQVHTRIATVTRNLLRGESSGTSASPPSEDCINNDCDSS
ncbi:hypothetical protein MLD38_012983 [Melastoma candidum]|uniref:Uncharacterized protein n=1 Tax=Melastoma candidum TaxID=119954 RepID=A0ACB9R9X9_9MYRT|nr:hypothetical protein MLD38_012983 [Melastoma candidum]